MIRVRETLVAVVCCLWSLAPALGGEAAASELRAPILFNTAFEGASLGRIETVDASSFRLHVRGQQDERGRNRQATWYFFRMDRVAGRELTLTFTDWEGEYNDIPGTVPMSAKLRPWLSEDGEHWRPIDKMTWDAQRKEATVTVRVESDRVWLAHLQPYPHSRLLRVLDEVAQSPHARVEVIGETVLGRELHLVTVTETDPAHAAADRKTVWLQARQHAWETGTSFVMEGALRFIVSDDPRARELRRRTIFKFTPMVDPDGCANGEVRFNANGYDLNRHWDRLDLNDPAVLRAMPESWYVKKAVLAQVRAGGVDLLVNLHNTRSEFMDSPADTEPSRSVVQRLFTRLVKETAFDPYRPVALGNAKSTMLALWEEAGVPVVLMELRTEPARKSATLPTAEERLAFGAELIAAMAESVRAPAP